MELEENIWLQNKTLSKFYHLTGNLLTSAIMLLEELKDFTNQTSIHGIGQIANDRAPVIKRIIWLAIFVGSLAYAGQQLASTIKGEITENIILTMSPVPKYVKLCVFDIKQRLVKSALGMK